MHKLRHVQDDQWAILDADDVPRFHGTLRDCEDWLDRQENLAGEAGWVRRWLSRLRAVLSRKRPRAQPMAPDEKCEQTSKEEMTGGAEPPRAESQRNTARPSPQQARDR